MTTLAQGIDVGHIGWAGAFVLVAGIIAVCFILWLFLS
jgi:hypothetical protein